MVTTVERRLRQLEAKPGGGGCDWCGDDGDNDKPFEVVFTGDLADDDPMKDWPDNCPGCGRRLVIYFDDDPNAPWNRGEAARSW